MTDYMLFGAGYSGELRHLNSGLAELKAFSKPKKSDAGNGRYSFKSDNTFSFTVERFVWDGKDYLIAWNGKLPSNGEVDAAIRKFNPKPL